MKGWSSFSRNIFYLVVSEACRKICHSCLVKFIAVRQHFFLVLVCYTTQNKTAYIAKLVNKSTTQDLYHIQASPPREVLRVIDNTEFSSWFVLDIKLVNTRYRVLAQDFICSYKVEFQYQRM